MIQADPLHVHQVLEQIRSLRVTTEAREGMGPFDIVALIEADGIGDLAPLLHRATFTIPGVCAAAAVLTESDSWREEGTAPNG
jgi:hypothetical protein